MLMGLLFTPLILLLAFNFSTVWSYLLIFIFTCFLLAIHAPSAIVTVIVLAPYILLNLKDNCKHSAGAGLAGVKQSHYHFQGLLRLFAPFLATPRHDN